MHTDIREHRASCCFESRTNLRVIKKKKKKKRSKKRKNTKLNKKKRPKMRRIRIKLSVHAKVKCEYTHPVYIINNIMTFTFSSRDIT